MMEQHKRKLLTEDENIYIFALYDGKFRSQTYVN